MFPEPCGGSFVGVSTGIEFCSPAFIMVFLNGLYVFQGQSSLMRGENYTHPHGRTHELFIQHQNVNSEIIYILVILYRKSRIYSNIWRKRRPWNWQRARSIWQCFEGKRKWCHYTTILRKVKKYFQMIQDFEVIFGSRYLIFYTHSLNSAIPWS